MWHLFHSACFEISNGFDEPPGACFRHFATGESITLAVAPMGAAWPAEALLHRAIVSYEDAPRSIKWGEANGPLGRYSTASYAWSVDERRWVELAATEIGGLSIVIRYVSPASRTDPSTFRRVVESAVLSTPEELRRPPPRGWRRRQASRVAMDVPEAFDPPNVLRFRARRGAMMLVVAAHGAPPSTRADVPDARLLGQTRIRNVKHEVRPFRTLDGLPGFHAASSWTSDDPPARRFKTHRAVIQASPDRWIDFAAGAREDHEEALERTWWSTLSSVHAVATPPAFMHDDRRFSMIERSSKHPVLLAS